MSFFRGRTRSRAGRGLLVTGIFAALTAVAVAQAEGPDYFRITGLKKEDRVNVRRAPNTDAKIVGRIPKDSDGIKNLGCKGGLTQRQWEKASEAKKSAAARERWCQVSFGDVTGWVLGRFLAEGSAPQGEAQQNSAPTAAPQPPQAAPETPAILPPTNLPPTNLPPMQSSVPSMDCSKAEKVWEKLTCADNELGAIDREAARLYTLASDALNATPGFEALLDGQRRWQEQRATCFDRECVAEMGVRRIHQLRRDFKPARTQDAKGISMGPLVARCEMFPLPIAVTYVNSDPGFAYLEWLGAYVVIPHVPSGSGVLYESAFARLHTKGSEAMLQVPGGKMELRCKLEAGG